ncbi:MAG: universal stress protein [Methanothrix sp.]|jgi:nucleotide-binding universal stress UspA family protein|uniref:universal stress protein n=1 Tax=Methanothrix sp. TaxID=90426 RepID=UPI0025DE85C4|nr:universal stress protein [Methanothrix sp.]MCK9406506.1 universal stress protein [Methanothrix sp.]
MFEKVLIATDFSKHAKKVIECIGEMPGLKEVLLLNVISRDPLARVWDPVSEIKDIEKKLEEEKNAIKSPEVTVNVKAVSVLEGEVASAINKVAMEENVSLVAMGARGRSLIMSTLLGSSSRNVLRFGRTHLLIMRYKTLDDNNMEKYCARVFAKVLFPTDLSQTSEVALSFLKSLEGIGEIVLLNVVSKGETDEEIKASVAAAKDRIEEIAQNLKMAGMLVSSKVVVGQPTEVIRSEAEKEDVSLIAISSQGASAIKKGRIGSTAYDVANSASRPVLILRQEKMAAY